MTVLASYNDKSDFTGEELTVAATGTLQFRVRGPYGPRGVVRMLLKGADGVFHRYGDLNFRNASTAVEVNLLAGDVIKVQFENCVAASAEVHI